MERREQDENKDIKDLKHHIQWLKNLKRKENAEHRHQGNRSPRKPLPDPLNKIPVEQTSGELILYFIKIYNKPGDVIQKEEKEHQGKKDLLANVVFPVLLEGLY